MRRVLIALLGAGLAVILSAPPAQAIRPTGPAQFQTNHRDRDDESWDDDDWDEDSDDDCSCDYRDGVVWRVLELLW